MHQSIHFKMSKGAGIGRAHIRTSEIIVKQSWSQETNYDRVAKVNMQKIYLSRVQTRVSNQVVDILHPMFSQLQQELFTLPYEP